MLFLLFFFYLFTTKYSAHRERQRQRHRQRDRDRKTKRERERERERVHPSKYIHKIIFWDQRFSRTINSKKIFTDTNPGIKKNRTQIKTFFPIKAWNKDFPNSTVNLVKITIKSCM